MSKIPYKSFDVWLCLRYSLSIAEAATVVSNDTVAHNTHTHITND